MALNVAPAAFLQVNPCKQPQHPGSLGRVKHSTSISFNSPQQQLEEPLCWKNVEVRDVFPVG